MAVGASCLAFAVPAAAGPPVQVNIYLPSYGQPAAPPPAPQATGQSAQSAIATANAATLQAEVAIAQAAAYQRYLQYVAVTGAQGGRGGGDPSQYFTNGASATTVPSGSSYFSNGAEATKVPGPPPAAPPPAPPVPPVAPQALQAPPAPPAPATPPPSAPLAPYWWTDGVPAAAATPPATAASTPAPTPSPSVDSREDRPAQAMSFAEWLQSMGANAPDVAATEANPSADLAEAPIAEPAAAVLEVRQRLPSVRREKSRERVLAGDGSSALVATMLGTFAAGVILGALAMKRPRARA